MKATGLTHEQIGRLTPRQVNDLLADPEKLEKQLKWKAMSPQAREISRQLGYYNG